jgi:hypothetical protein
VVQTGFAGFCLYFTNSNIPFYILFFELNPFPALCDRKKFSKSIALPARLCQLPILQNLCRTGALFAGAMSTRWCECDKCDGGKLVPRATWYRHQRKTHTPGMYSRAFGARTSARVKLSPDLAVVISKNSDVDRPVGPDPADIIEPSPRSNIVSVTC